MFLLLLMGIFEFGLLLRNDLALGNAAVAGARAASVAADDPDADFRVLRAIAHGADAWGAANLDFVVVFRAAGPDEQVPAECKTGPVAGVCNYFRPADFNLPYEDVAGDLTPYWGCVDGSVDEFWCPADRPVSLSWVEPASSGFNDGPAYIGVYLQGRHRFATRIFGDSMQLSETRVLQLEPRLR